MSDEAKVREDYVLWLAVWEKGRGRSMTPTESNAAWAAYKHATARAREEALEEAAIVAHQAEDYYDPLGGDGEYGEFIAERIRAMKGGA